MGRWLRRLLTWLLWVGMAAAVAGWIYGRKALPQVQGEWRLEGLGAPVRIERDAQGIPTVRASSLRDALFGLGVVHAQDRLWQMETHRRIGAGRLAEAFGEAALDTDRFLRTLGLRRVAAEQWARLRAQPDPATRDALAAYAAGVQAAVARMGARPPEFLLLGLQPEAWTPEDSLSWAMVMALDLGANWQAEVLRLRLALKLPKERIDQLLPPYPGDPVPATMDYAAFYRALGLGGADSGLGAATLERLMARTPLAEIEGLGSNSWAVGPGRSETGAPLLANDPHLKLSSPSLWYLVRIEVPGLSIAGASMPGLPGIVMGQNQHLAWGLTNTGPDVQDLYLERRHPDQPERYQTPDGWATFETHPESIRVRGGPAQSLQVRRSRHGPVVSDLALTGLREAGVGGAQARHVLALRWTGLDADADAVGTALKMMQARTVEEMRAAASTWVAPMQNIAVADREGRIALYALGRVPRRGPDHDLGGLAPAPGWEARYDWQGFVPAAELPAVVDPPEGVIANANQKVTPPGYPHFLSHQWALPYRHQRILALLAARPKHSLASLRDIQADQQSLAAQRLLPRLQAVASSHPLAAAAKAQLRGFDGTMAADRAAPLIFWAWQRQLSLRVLVDELGESLHERLTSQRGYFDALENLLGGSDSGRWCDDRSTSEVESCDLQAQRAFDAALDELQKLQGPDPAAWQWGRAHQARSEHRPFSRVKLLARWFEQRQPMGGDAYTVNVGRVGLKPDATTGEFYLDEHGPSLRALYDLADRSRSTVIHSTGQSGLPWSPHFGDFAARWGRVEALPLFAPASAAAPDVLRLEPAGPVSPP